MLSCMSYLYILDINPLLIISFVNIFSHSVGYLFLLSMISFAMQKFLSLIRPHLFIFVFISFALGDKYKKKEKKRKLLQFISKTVLCFPLSFMVSGLTFRSIIHFKFLFIYGARESSNFLLLYAGVQFSLYHILKRLSSLHCIFLLPLS